LVSDRKHATFPFGKQQVRFDPLAFGDRSGNQSWKAAKTQRTAEEALCVAIPLEPAARF
jgi:hypothetical protein